MYEFILGVLVCVYEFSGVCLGLHDIKFVRRWERCSLQPDVKQTSKNCSRNNSDVSLTALSKTCKIID